ncbi:DUF3040 domain-containing protein [Streptomyces sp. NPDC054940]
MPESDDDRIADLEARLRRDDPRFVRGLGRRRPCRPRQYRRGGAWLLMVLALAAVVVGTVLPHGLLLGAGLAAAGCAVSLVDASGQRRTRPPKP